VPLKKVKYTNSKIQRFISRSQKDIFIVGDRKSINKLFNTTGIIVMGECYSHFYGIQSFLFKKEVFYILDEFFPINEILVGEYSKKEMNSGEISGGPFPFFLEENIIEEYFEKDIMGPTACEDAEILKGHLHKGTQEDLYILERNKKEYKYIRVEV